MALPSVDKAFLWAPGIGYVHIDSFEAKTAQELAVALDSMGGQKLKGLLLDLRDDHGGIVDTAAMIAGLFLKKDDLVLTTRDAA